MVLASMPSLSLEMSPMTTQPTVSSARLRATPCRPPGNSTISFIITPERPSMAATPSARETMVPTLDLPARASRPAMAFWICSIALLMLCW